MQRKNEKTYIFKNNEKGITLIALIITIIVLIIVAGVAINMTVGENGIITKARLAKEKEEVASLSEKLELQKANVKLDNNKSLTLDSYLEQLKLENIIEDIDIEETGEENSRYIEVEDKYIFSVTDLKNGDVKIEYEGKTGKLIPKIKGIEVTKVTTNSITVKVSAIRVDDGNYKYYIKNITDGETYALREATNKEEYILKETSKSDEYTFTGLEQNKEYKIQVEVINKNGSTLRETEGNIKTIPVQALTSANINFTYTPNYWTNEKVTVSVSLKDGITIPEGSKIQTSKDAKDWSNTTLQEFTENGYIYVRVWDGINGGGYAAGEVSKIDTDAPQISTALSSKDVTTKGFTLSIGITDGGSGLGKIIWYYKKSTDTKYTSAEEKYTDINGENAGTTTATTKTKEYNNLTSGTYNAYAEVYDVAGNKTTTEIISVTLGDVTGLNTSNIKFTYTPNYWTNGKVTAKAELNGISLKTGEKLQVSTDGTNYVDGSSKEYSANGNFYVRVSDGTNIGTAASAQVSKIDTTKPIVTNVSSTTTSITITATDEASGIIGYKVTTSDAAPSSFDSCENTTSLSTTVSSLTQNTTYYVWVKDEAGNVSASKSIKTAIQLVTGITLNKTTTSININATETLTATVSPDNANNKNVTWKSSNTAIATVSSSGVVKGIKAGTATITVTAADGSGKTATCNVIVRDESIKVLVIGDVAYEQKGSSAYKNKIQKYFKNVDYNNSMTIDELKASNYDVYVDVAYVWAASKPDVVNALYTAGKNIITCSNDATTFSIIKDKTQATTSYTATRNISNALTNKMDSTITEQSDSLSLIHFIDGVEKLYTTTYNSTSYDVIGCATGTNGNRWLHCSLREIPEKNLKDVITYVAGGKLNLNGVTSANAASFSQNSAGNYSITTQSGHEKMNVPIVNLIVGKNYKLNFSFQIENATYINNYTHSYQISSSIKTDNADSAYKYSFTKNANENNYTVEFTADAKTMYININLSDVSDNKTYAVHIKEKSIDLLN